jgi:signal transduction histidine kinase/CheY-like chemotaxis protein
MKNKLIAMIISLGVSSIIVVLIISYQSIQNLNFLEQEFENILNNQNEKIRLSKDIEIELLKMYRAQRNLIDEEKDELKDKYKLNFLKNKNNIDKSFLDLIKLINFQNKELEEFKINYTSLIRNFDEILRLLSQSKQLEAQYLLKNNSKILVDTSINILSEIISYNEKTMLDSIQSNKESQLELELTFKYLVGILLFSLLVMILNIYIYISNRLKKINDLILIIKENKYIDDLILPAKEEKNELGLIKKTLYEAILLLKENHLIQEEQNWLKNSIIELSSSLYEKQNLNDILDTSILTICRKINAIQGVIYLYNDLNQMLTFSSSFACNNERKKNHFTLGEGVVGQVALEKKSILLKNLTEEYIIDTGIIKTIPKNIYVYPLIYKNQLIGVIELSSFEIITDIQKDYLIAFSETLSSIIFSSLLANKTKELLNTTQEQSNILKNSQQKLEIQNEELEEQRKQLEEQTRILEMSQRELETQNLEIIQSKEEIEKRSKDLEDANKYKSDFLANMSHELRTPLNSINILSKILSRNKDGNLTTKQTEQANTIYNSGKDLLQLINDILDLSKIEAKMISLNLEKVILKELLKEIFNLFYSIAKEKKINLDLIIDDSSEFVIYTDREKVKQIINNFLSNAIKFTSSNKNISITLNSNIINNKMLPIEISVIDEGIGIPHDKHEIIFEAFKQVDGSTSRKYGGTGLGLSISKELANILNGKIIVNSKENKGSTFSLLLPIQIDTTNIDKNLIDIIPYREISNQLTLPFVVDDRFEIHNNDKIILIIEDDEKFANILKDEINKFNLKAIISTNGDEGLMLAEKYQPLGIILDINLPTLNGWEVLKLLKANVETRHIPVKIMSVETPNIIMKKMGAIDFVQKTGEITQLELSIKDLIISNDKEKQLLIVEDNDIQKENLIDIMKSEDIKVTAVSSGNEAIDLIKNNNFDCAIIDINLFDICGFELLKIIKENNSDLPIVIYSARDFTTNELKILREYSESVVIKTVESEARLIDETSLFLHRLNKNYTTTQKKLLHNSVLRNNTFNGKKILIVDDDIRNIFALSSLLTENGFDIIASYNGEEALKELENDIDIDIILMDIMMPIMDGYETIEKIRNDKRFKKIPIIALTAKAQKKDREKCLNKGANDYISKPIDEEQLLQLMKIWLINK